MSESSLQTIRAGGPADQMTVLAALREVVVKANPDATVEVSGEAGDEKLTVRHGEVDEAEVRLSNLWTQLRGLYGEEAAEVIERFGRGTISWRETVESVETVMPAVQCPEFIEAVRERGGQPVHLPLTAKGDLLLCLVADAEDHVRYLMEGELPQDVEKLKAEAISNLNGHVRDSGFLRVEVRTIEAETLGVEAGEASITFYLVRLDEHYEATLVLLRELLENLCRDPDAPLGTLESTENLALAMPSRDQLILCDARDPHAVVALSVVAGVVLEGAAYSISSDVFRYSSEPGKSVMLEAVEVRDR